MFFAGWIAIQDLIWTTLQAIRGHWALSGTVKGYRFYNCLKILVTFGWWYAQCKI